MPSLLRALAFLALIRLAKCNQDPRLLPPGAGPLPIVYWDDFYLSDGDMDTASTYHNRPPMTTVSEIIHLTTTLTKEKTVTTTTTQPPLYWDDIYVADGHMDLSSKYPDKLPPTIVNKVMTIAKEKTITASSIFTTLTTLTMTTTTTTTPPPFNIPVIYYDDVYQSDGDVDPFPTYHYKLPATTVSKVITITADRTTTVSPKVFTTVTTTTTPLLNILISLSPVFTTLTTLTTTLTTLTTTTTTQPPFIYYDDIYNKLPATTVSEMIHPTTTITTPLLTLSQMFTTLTTLIPITTQPPINTTIVYCDDDIYIHDDGCMDFPTRYHKHHRPTIVSEIIHLTTTTTTTTIAASPILTTLTILTTTTTTSLPSPSPQLLKIIKAGEPSLINPGAVYIRAASLFNNKNKTSSSIIVGYAAPHPQNPRWKSLLTSISNDGGLSWQYRGQVTHTQNPFSSNQKKDRPFSQDIDNSFILQLPSGRLLYAFRNHDMRRKKGSSWKPEYFRITICASDDNGLEWFYLSQVDQNVASVRGGEKNGIWEPFLRLGLKGEVQVYYSEEKLENRQENVMRYSHDGGKTWSEEKIIVSDGPDFWPIGWYGISKDGMIGVTQRGKEPGKLIAVFQSTYYRGVFSITGIESDDDGYTWRKKDRKRIYTAPNGKHAGAPQVINLGGGKALVVSFMSSEHTMQGKPADWDGNPKRILWKVDDGLYKKRILDDVWKNKGWIDGGELMLIVSFDEGKTWSGNGKSQEWQMGMMTVDKGCHWPGLYALNEDEFLVLYTKDGLGGVSQRFKLVPVQRTEKRGLGDELSATSKIISAST